MQISQNMKTTDKRVEYGLLQCDALLGNPGRWHSCIFYFDAQLPPKQTRHNSPQTPQRIFHRTQCAPKPLGIHPPPPKRFNGGFNDMDHRSMFTNHTPLQKYWDCEANPFIFAVDLKFLSLTFKKKNQYETKDQLLSFNFQLLLFFYICI